MSHQRVPRQATGFLVDQLDDELLLYHPALETAVYLNDTAFLVWRLCDGRRSEASIIDLLEHAFPEAASNIRAEVATTLQRLAEQDVIEFL